MSYELILGDCIDAMKAMPDNSIDAVVTDPPYGLGFMGKEWDSYDPTVNSGSFKVGTGTHPQGYVAIDKPAFQQFSFQWATEVIRILKPGGHLLSFGGSRTYHRMACAIEDAGFEIRDQLQWIYSQGFPKSLDVSKAIDKMAGAEREVVGKHSCPAGRSNSFVQERTNAEAGIFSGSTKYPNGVPLTSPATPEAQYWQGWGTALKPAHEPIVLARKPITGTVANNVLAYGTGGINIDGCRIGTEQTVTRRNGDSGGNGAYGRDERIFERTNPPGRFPANILHDGSDEVVGMFPNSKSTASGYNWEQGADSMFMGKASIKSGAHFADSGSAARFFYSAKASRSERNAGLEGMEEKRPHPEGNGYGQTTMWNGENGDEEWRKKNPNTPAANHHPTVKPIAVMRWLVRLITPPNGTVLDPFTGSGTTGIAAVLEGFDFIGIEREAEYHEIARRRIEHWSKGLQLTLPVGIIER